MMSWLKLLIAASEKTGIVTAASAVTALQLTNKHETLLCMHIVPATNATTVVDVLVKAGANASLQDITPTWSTLSTAAGRFLFANVYTTATGATVDTDVDTITTAQTGYFEMDVSGLTEIDIKVTAAGAGTVSLYWTLT